MFLILSHIFLHIINFVKWTPVTSSAESASSTSSPTEEERDKQGTHELELHYSGELDLHQHFKCVKNPGHVDFKPVCSLLDCPVNGRFESNSLLLQHFTMWAAAITTKLKVQYVSSNRSKVKRRNKNMELSQLAGQRVTSYGSGFVTGIDVSGDQSSFPCPLENCPHSTQPRRVYGYIIITTAAHVVFDDDEAKETIVEFLDDDPKDKGNVETAHGVKVRNCSVEGDFCQFMCVTHSESLFKKMSWLCSPNIQFETDFYLRVETLLMRILRLFELIKMINKTSRGNSYLQDILGCGQNSCVELHKCLSEWQGLHSKGGNIKESALFLSAAESASGIAGLKDSVQNILYQDDANFPQDFCKEFCTNIDVETAVKRIALIGTFHILLRSIGPVLNNEGIYIFFSDILNAVEDTDSQLKGWHTETFLDPLDEIYFENIFSEIKDFAVKDQDAIILAIKKWFRCAKESLLPTINDRLHTMLKCQLITKLSPHVTVSFSQIMDNCQQMSEHLDQISSTLSLHFRDGNNRESQSDHHIPDHGIRGKCRHLTQLWIANRVIPKDDDFSRAMLDLCQKNCHLIKKGAEIQELLRISRNLDPAISVENLRQSLFDTEEMFNGVRKCVFQSENAFIKEVKGILHVPSDMIQQQRNDPFLIHVSHPHGQSKQVTTGEYIACSIKDTGHYEHIYNVPTCNGGSGGPVWIVPSGEDGKILWDQVYGVPHSGCYDRDNKLNHSASWTFSPFLESQKMKELNSIVPKQQHFQSPYVSRESGSTAAETAKKKEWLLNLPRSVDRQVISGMSVEHAIDFKSFMEQVHGFQLITMLKPSSISHVSITGGGPRIEDDKNIDFNTRSSTSTLYPVLGVTKN